MWCLGSIVGFQPLTSPNLIPLALAIGWMGIWICEKHGIKSTRVTSKKNFDYTHREAQPMWRCLQTGF